MRIAIAFSGQLRTGKHTSKNIKTFFNEDNIDIDYYGHTWTYNTNRQLGGTHALPEKVDPKEFEFIAQEYNFKEFLIEEKEPELIGMEIYYWSPLFYSMWKSFELIRNSGIKYDIIVKMRYDLSFRNNTKFSHFLPHGFYQVYDRWIMPSFLAYPGFEYSRKNVSEIMFWGDEDGMYSAAELYLYKLTVPTSDGLVKIINEGPGITLGNYANLKNIKIPDPHIFYKTRPDMIVRNEMIGAVDLGDHDAMLNMEKDFHEIKK